IVSDKKTGQILGAVVIGHEASNLIAEMALAIQNELTLDSVIETIYAHPTLAESWHEAALIAKELPVNFPPKMKKCTKSSTFYRKIQKMRVKADSLLGFIENCPSVAKFLRRTPFWINISSTPFVKRRNAQIGLSATTKRQRLFWLWGKSAPATAAFAILTLAKHQRDPK